MIEQTLSEAGFNDLSHFKNGSTSNSESFKSVLGVDERHNLNMMNGNYGETINK